MVSESSRKKFADFEARYSHLRSKEGRPDDVEFVRRLPDVPVGYAGEPEWRMRRDTIGRFMRYIRRFKRPLSILDVGCGNGFFSNMLAERGHKVIGMDVTLCELRTAAAAFGADNPRWCYADLLTDDLPFGPFELIIFNASLHYFGDVRPVLDRAFGLLTRTGEIHVMETPFYKDEAARDKARKATAAHFLNMDSPGMMGAYHFHSWDDLGNFRYDVLKKPGGRIGRWLGRPGSPFYWIRLRAEGNGKFYKST